MHPGLRIAAEAPHVLLDAVDSTNQEALRRADAGEEGPLWLEAIEQTAGRGRRGRTWTGYAGNLFLTYMSRPEAPASALALLGFVGALAASDVARDVLGPDRVRVKWPNDGLIDGRKWCGVLVESGRAQDGRPYVALGIGLNLVGAPEATPYGAISLAGAGAPLARPVASQRLRAALQAWSERLVGEGFAPLRTAWEERAFGLGGPCHVEVGDVRLEGAALGLSADGALRLAGADGTERMVTAGEVFFSSAASR